MNTHFSPLNRWQAYHVMVSVGENHDYKVRKAILINSVDRALPSPLQQIRLHRAAQVHSIETKARRLIFLVLYSSLRRRSEVDYSSVGK